MHSILMRSLVTILMKICSIFVWMIAQTDCFDFNELAQRNDWICQGQKQSRIIKISKFTLQICEFVYYKLMDFPSGWLDFDALTTQDLFESVHRGSGSELTKINFASCSQVKFFNTMKYYLLSLGSLASTPFDEVEKMHLKKLTLQFLNQLDYFLQIWHLLVGFQP